MTAAALAPRGLRARDEPVEMARSEIGHAADALAVLIGPNRTVRKAAEDHGFSQTVANDILRRPGALNVAPASLDKIAAAVGVSRADLLAGRAPKSGPRWERSHPHRIIAGRGSRRT